MRLLRWPAAGEVYSLSAEQAMQRLSSKLPFSAMDPVALQQYVAHGMKPVPQQQQQQQQQQQHQHQQQQHQQMVQLVCSPTVEAAWYKVLNPPPAVPMQAVNCPIAFAYAAEGGHGDHIAIYDHADVQSWLQQQQQQLASGTSSAGRQSDGLHGVLRLLNMELAAALPAANILQVAGSVALWAAGAAAAGGRQMP